MCYREWSSKSASGTKVLQFKQNTYLVSMVYIFEEVGVVLRLHLLL